MITEDYVSFETAKLLKEKGFDWKCKRMFRVSKNFGPKFYDSPEWITNEDLCDLYQNCEFATIPTIQMAMKWLREVHGLFPVVEPFLTEETKPKYWVYVIWHNSIPKYMQSKLNYYTPEEACEAAIKYCLENLI